jgi:hypothetical protein
MPFFIILAETLFPVISEPGDPASDRKENAMANKAYSE